MNKERYTFDLEARARATETANILHEILIERAGANYAGRQQMDDTMALLYLAKVRATGCRIKTNDLVGVAENLWQEHDEFVAALAEEERLASLRATEELMKSAGVQNAETL